jgi:hypothetical protein
MRRVFADSQYWVALLNNQDQSHATARAISHALHGVDIVTTEGASPDEAFVSLTAI